MKECLMRKTILPLALAIFVLSQLVADANVRIMSYNIKDFWLRFDGEPGIMRAGSDPK